MMDITTDPDYWVQKLGLVILHHQGGEKGRHYPGTRIISLRSGLAPIARRCTLMHEIAHYIHGDVPTSDPWLNTRQERRAHEWAAQRLISKEAYEQAEAIVGPHPGALAAELGVTVEYIHTWREMCPIR